MTEEQAGEQCLEQELQEIRTVRPTVTVLPTFLRNARWQAE